MYEIARLGSESRFFLGIYNLPGNALDLGDTKITMA